MSSLDATSKKREEIANRFEAARQKKRDYVEQLEQKMKADFKERTNQEATYFEVW